ncbi:MAG: plasmid pRiA4b ORF-3 family protein [Pyrinomonadaceae bacterium]|nr:plasmid pRiA4b ORF-3 family protein [Pyrinomonadaceae bacterium]
MPTRKSPTDISIYQMKITLRGSKPPIWRRVEVRSDTTLHNLHWIIQTAMGWTNSHLHQFIVGQQYYSQPDFGIDEHGVDVKNERAIKLGQIASRAKAKFIYEYDFGDGWEHEVVVEKILTAEAGMHYPKCLTGKRACPPEDCGGVWGYAGFLEAIKDPEHPEHEDMLEWVGGSFDPEAFDIEEVNQELKGLGR